MARYASRIARSLVAAAAAWWLVSGGPARAQDNDIWDRPPGGFWELGANWADGSVPGNLDSATFNVAGAYLVEFGTVPNAIRELNLTAGNVTFASASSAAFRTLNVTSSLFGGPQDVYIRNGASLSLGTVNGFTIMPLHLTVGHALFANAGTTLNVRFGSDVITPRLSSDGQINVTGLGSALTASSTSIDDGSLNVTAGGVVQTDNAEINSMGTVSGAGSQWIATGTITVGQVAAGASVSVTTGGVVQSGAATISRDGQVTVSGNGSQWTATTMTVGQSSDGTLTIMGGGKVQSQNGAIGTLGARGDVAISGSDSQWNLSGNLSVGSESGTLNVTGGGSVSSADGSLGGNSSDSDGTATITGGAWTTTGQLSVGGIGDFHEGGQGTLNIQPAGVVSAAQGVFLFSGGHVNLQGGTLDASAISYFLGTQGNQFQWTSGTLHVGTFNGNLVNSSGVLAPGHSPGSTTVNGNYTQQNDGDLEIEIGGPLAGSEFDFLDVNGNALLDGELNLKLTGGFLPTPAQTFAILISNGLSGAFDNVASGQRVTTTDGGGSFLVHYGFGSPFDDNQVILSAFQALGFPGDYNQNGTVDAADYTVWRDHLGQNTPLANTNPADVDGVVTQAEYAYWKSRFGATSGSGAAAGANVVVPEPTALVLVTLAWLASVTLRRSQSSRYDLRDDRDRRSLESVFKSGNLWKRC